MITTFNHAHYLAAALSSARAQSTKADQIVVVDDGSSDNPAQVVARFAEVELITQPNRGLSAARNAGLKAVRTDFVVFLDADDLLAEDALAAGLACFERVPHAALVYGAHRRVDANGIALGPERFTACGEDPFRDLLRGNIIAMHAAVMYRRALLEASGGFNTRWRRCEDYDVYLRLARSHPIACHSAVVADYRIHGANMSRDHAGMHETIMAVHAAFAPAAEASPALWRAHREGRENIRRYYAQELLSDAQRSWAAAQRRRSVKLTVESVRVGKAYAVRQLGRSLRQRARRLADRVLARDVPPRIGKVDFGDFAKVQPISTEFGFDRGTPIDRHYIEGFLSRHRQDIRGRVLEVGDDHYTRKFGDERVTRADILHVHAGNPRASIVGSLEVDGTLPPASFDAIVLTQVLHLVFDMRAALQQLHAALAPGGVLLLTVPGISQIERGEWGASWYWSLTEQSARRLLLESFPAADIAVETHGNAFAATAFLQGVAADEVDPALLGVLDACYPVTVAARAIKAAST